MNNLKFISVFSTPCYCVNQVPDIYPLLRYAELNPRPSIKVPTTKPKETNDKVSEQEDAVMQSMCF